MELKLKRNKHNKQKFLFPREDIYCICSINIRSKYGGKYSSNKLAQINHAIFLKHPFHHWIPLLTAFYVRDHE